MSQNDADTQGIHHLGLTVANVLEAAKFFVDILGFEQVGESLCIRRFLSQMEISC